AALIKLLGDHVGQAGSYNGPDYARFDFNHFEKVTAQQLREIERMVNEMIAANVPVTTEVLPVEEAKNTGAIALFDEKYGDTVRVVTIGEYSKELCGGTHAADTGDLGLFKIVSEESIGSGIRRITCVTKLIAYEAFRAEEDYLNEAAAMFRLPNHIGLKEKIEQQRNEIDALRKEVAEAQRKAMNAEADHALEKAEEINGLNVLFLKVKDMDAQAMKDYADMLRGRLKNSVIFLTNAEDDKVTFVGALSNAAVEKGLNAGTMVRTAAAVCGGKGGGRPDLAQAGGRDTQKVPQAIEAVRELIG
ncbi:MAG: alanine--tRNA ligase, partial [Solobacterium sp.]|nr:alanine--tRNA ligase [Solobacterium sp.]